VRVNRVPLPPGIAVVEDEPGREDEPTYRVAPEQDTVGRLVLERRWFGLRYLALLAFCIFWDGFLFLWYTHAPRDAPLVFFVFPLLHVGAGLVVTYVAITGLFNHTRITVDATGVTVKHGPLPFPGNATIPRAELAQLFCEEVRSNKGAHTYRLSAIVARGAKRALLSGLPNAAQARYLEQRIEERLGIVDAEVVGEYRG
jgi:hypothetical protein